MLSMLCSRGESCSAILDLVFVRIYNDIVISHVRGYVGKTLSFSDKV
jgi:hypothetical protein